MTSYADSADRFAADTTDHVMTVLHDDGLYRHLRFQAPDSSFHWFDLITWPGVLAIRGSHGHHMFSRLNDMFAFFRTSGAPSPINPGYWAEKMPDYGEAVRRYDENILKAKLDDHLAEYAEQYEDLAAAHSRAHADYLATPIPARYYLSEPVAPKTPDELRELVSEHDEDGLLADESSARVLLRQLEQAGVVSDTWEWDLRDWDYHYLWCCHAIVWGIAQYDAARAGAVEVAAAVTR